MPFDTRRCPTYVGKMWARAGERTPFEVHSDEPCALIQYAASADTGDSYDRRVRYWQPKLRTVQRGVWLQFDDSRRIAVIRVVELSNPPRRLLRAETWAADPGDRELIGYFPVDELRLAAETVWSEYQATRPPAVEVTVERQQYSSGDVPWHPLLNADEGPPGEWSMRDSTGAAYGRVRIMKDGDATVYAAELRGRPIGRYDRLRPAVEAVHAAYVAANRNPNDCG